MAAGKSATKYNKNITKAQSKSAQKTSSKAAAAKKASSSTAPKSRKQAVVSEPEKHGMSLTVAIILGLFAAMILELSNFDILGRFGGWLKYGQFGLFGVMAYIFPVGILMLFIVSTYEEDRFRFIFSGILIFIFLCSFAHLVSSSSLNNHNVISYFTTCADDLKGGGILGGAVALGLYMLLSKTGAIIISVLVILVCLFFIAEEPILGLISWIFYRDEPEESYEENDNVPEDDYEDERYERYERDLRTAQKQKKVKERYYDEKIGETEDSSDGTVIQIVRTRRKKGRVQSTKLIRTTRKAAPTRDGSTDLVRSGNRVRGLSNNTQLIPYDENEDEIREITRRSSSGRTAKPKKQVSLPPVIDSTEESVDPFVEVKPGEAAVTSVQEAAVNRRIKEARPVKVRKAEQMTIDDIQKEEPAVKPVRRTSARAVPAQISSASDDDQVYYAPPIELLARPKNRNKASDAELEKIARNLELILEQFGVTVTVTDIQAGPSVTRFELQPELGTRVNKITSLADDLKLNLGVTEIRIEAPIPGRQAVGIEIPNKNRQTVYMRELLEEPTLINHPSKIAFAAGKDISGNVVVSDIAKMPHLLVAGTTGSGKSVFLNTILMTILYRAKPSEVGLIIVDPKKVEFGIYAGIPHLMKDVVTDPGQAVSTLRWAVNEMTNRYQRMQMSAVRDYKAYNAKVEKGTVSPEEENPRKMNLIVIIIDELADLMMVAKKEAEALICRLAQLARAAGIHLIIATQRPSVDVVTGLIKANVPARVALLVSSQIDSRTIIDMQGAEKLLGNGDMLFYPTGYVKPVRIQGAFVSDDEIQQTVDYLIKNNKQNYFAEEAKEIEKYMNSQADESSAGGSEPANEGAGKYDECFYEAGKMCIEMGKASSSMLQRRFNLGFNRAARIIDQLEDFGAVGPQNGAKPREILVDSMTFEEMYQELTGKK